MGRLFAVSWEFPYNQRQPKKAKDGYAYNK
jgi:hypothetical protein